MQRWMMCDPYLQADAVCVCFVSLCMMCVCRVPVWFCQVLVVSFGSRTLHPLLIIIILLPFSSPEVAAAEMYNSFLCVRQLGSVLFKYMSGCWLLCLPDWSTWRDNLVRESCVKCIRWFRSFELESGRWLHQPELLLFDWAEGEVKCEWRVETAIEWMEGEEEEEMSHEEADTERDGWESSLIWQLDKDIEGKNSYSYCYCYGQKGRIWEEEAD